MDGGEILVQVRFAPYRNPTVATPCSVGLRGDLVIFCSRCGCPQVSTLTHHVGLDDITSHTSNLSTILQGAEVQQRPAGGTFSGLSKLPRLMVGSAWRLATTRRRRAARAAEAVSVVRLADVIAPVTGGANWLTSTMMVQ